MLWRVILSAVAVSCTLSRTHAHGPIDRIKDLMCVLLLSGMQKEDLDVSMLNKLQRFNVNIHDTNNDELLKDCMALRNKTNNDTINTTPEYFKTNVVSETTHTDVSVLYTQTNPTQPDKNISIQTFNTDKKKHDDAIEYANGKPKLDSVLKFWNDMKLEQRETTETTKNNNHIERSYVSESKNKRNVDDEVDEEDDIKRLLENYFSSRKNNRNGKRTTEATTQKVFINIYKDLIQTRQNNKMNDFQPDRNPPYLLPFGDQRQSNSPLRIISDRDEPRPYERNFSDIIASLGRFSHQNEDKVRYPKENKRIYDNPFSRSFVEAESVVSTTERERQQQFSSDMIKELANSVKELVMKDLKLKMQETTTTSTTTTTIQTTQVTKITEATKDNNVKIQESVLKKFVEMFEEFKSLKKNSVVISSTNNKDNVQRLLPLLPGKMADGTQIYNNPFGQYPKGPQLNFNFGPQEHKFRSNEAIVPVKQPSKRLIPITFQTNNLEIPPLGIPISNPLNPISQNIIVTTETPYRIGAIKNVMRPRINPFEDVKKVDEYLPKPAHMSKTRNNYNVPFNEDDVERFSVNNGVKHHANYYDKRNSNYRPRSDIPYMKTPEIQRFHERLENIDFLDAPGEKRHTDRVDCCNEKYAYSKQMVECCNRKIASRQQLSLNNMKKGSYDDTHFKNFLKTQQKVTDMLERILNTRDKVRSVETL